MVVSPLAVGSVVPVFVPWGAAAEPRFSRAGWVSRSAAGWADVSSPGGLPAVRFWRVPGSSRFVACASLSEWLPSVSAFFVAAA